MKSPKPTLWIVLAVLVILLSGIGGAWWRIQSGKGLWFVHKATGTSAEATEDDHDHDEDSYYTCPMHPQIVREQTGDCPVCGMSLVLKKRTAGGGEIGLVEISPTIVQTIGMTSERAQRRKLVNTIRTTGRVAFDEKKMKEISAWVPGRIEKLYVDFTGDFVRKGEPLLEIYSPQLLTTQQEYLLALKGYEQIQNSPISEAITQAKSLVSASRERLRLWGLTDAQIEEIRAAGQPQTTMTITSPISGVAIHKTAVEGMYVKEGTHLYKIADLSTVWVNADVYESDLPFIHVGQEVSVTLRAMPGQTFAGKVTFIHPVLDPKTRTVTVRCEFDNSEMLFKPNMYADVFFNVEIDSNALTVPESAVIYTGSRRLVVHDRSEGRFMPVEITLGAFADGYYQVLSGLSEGDKVVTNATFLIDSESNLRAAVAKLMAGEGEKGSEGEKESVSDLSDLLDFFEE
ncbi:MAG: efflux RND transporter periplasmic adaptor subunit [Candidatus Poribacteria bacterium]|nr:efflux RND transporter periplasmic adaptor subunit [Candidatus Poribacteria bacterium]